MQESPVKIDALLEPLLTATSDEHADQILSQLISSHAEPVIKGVIRFESLADDEVEPEGRDWFVERSRTGVTDRAACESEV